MVPNRIFNLFVAVALVIVIASTVREAVAITMIGPQPNSVPQCANLPSRHSIRTEYYMEEADMWIIRTEDGPTGVDGGLSELLSSYRICSR